jgi:hypothetical protein
MKAYRGSRTIDPLNLHLGTRWTLVVNIAPLPLDHQKDRRDPFIVYMVGPKAGLYVSEKT